MRVDSLEERRKKRLRTILFSILCLVGLLLVELVIYLITRGHGKTYNPAGYGHLISIALLFASMFGFLRLVKYVGAAPLKMPAGHMLLHPGSAEELGVLPDAQVQVEG